VRFIRGYHTMRGGPLNQLGALSGTLVFGVEPRHYLVRVSSEVVRMMVVALRKEIDEDDLAVFVEEDAGILVLDDPVLERLVEEISIVVGSGILKSGSRSSPCRAPRVRRPKEAFS